jgi:carbonic anhydrase
MQTKNITKFVLCCGIGSLGLTTPLLAASDAPWDYHGKEGPTHWAQLSPAYSACGIVGTQSPIRIEPLFAQQERTIQINYQPVGFNMKRQADDTYFFSDKPVSDTITLDNHTYRLQEIHFHVPAEHQLGNQKYPMEAHLVHADEQGNHLAIAVLMETGTDSPFLMQELAAMRSHKLHVILNPDILLPKKSTYYIYDGSLTIPPCPPVKWVVMKSAMTVSKEQLNEFKQKITSMNARPLQVRGNREIIEVVK